MNSIFQIIVLSVIGIYADSWLQLEFWSSVSKQIYKPATKCYVPSMVNVLIPVKLTTGKLILHSGKSN